MLSDSAEEKFDQAIRSMDKKIRDISETISGNIIPETKQILAGNVFKAILISFCIGLVSGLLISLSGRRCVKNKKK